MFYNYLLALLLGLSTALSTPVTADESEYNIFSLNLLTPTNRSFKVIVDGHPVFLRIGRDHPEVVGIDRAREIKYLKVGEMLGLTPALLGYQLDNGILMTEFIEGITPDTAKMHDLRFLQKVVDNLRTLHAHQPKDSQDVEKTTFAACRHFYRTIETLNVPFDRERAAYWMDVMQSFEEGYYEGIGKAVCHGDIYHGNLLEAFDGKVYLIDWEYAFYGYVIDDLGKLGTDALSDEEIQYISSVYWGKDDPDMYLKLKQNVFMHELVHYFWCLLQADKNPGNAAMYDQRAALMIENLDRAASIVRGQP